LIAVYLFTFDDGFSELQNYLMDSELRITHGQAARETVLTYSWAKEVSNLTTFLNSF